MGPGMPYRAHSPSGGSSDMQGHPMNRNMGVPPPGYFSNMMAPGPNPHHSG